MIELGSQGKNIEVPKINPQIIERVITLNSSDPMYPLSRPFEDYYQALTGDVKDYALKYAIATALIKDGRYRDLRFLTNSFVPQGTEILPEVEKLRQNLRLQAREAFIQRGDKRELLAAKAELERYAASVAADSTAESDEFKKYISLFGSSRAIDLLYRIRPEFKGIPVEHVKGIIADYLGGFLMTRGTFSPDDIKEGIEYLSDPSLQEGLLEVIKDNCLSFYNFSKKSPSHLSDLEIFAEYFEILDLEVASINNPFLSEVLANARNYYQKLFDIQKPARMIDALRSDRGFPDINQLININELAEKKRMLIADEMGLGKSASAILAKESLGLKQGVIVAPSNVIETWRTYLSDHVDSGGYFKPGHAPKVFVVSNPEDLKREDTSSYDYVLISHERLTDEYGYTDLLLGLNYDMLIVDEVHKFKNLEEGVRAANLVRLAEKVEGEDKYLALLSGTPVPNKVKDVAMILKLLYPERFKDVSNRNLVQSIINGDIVDIRNLLVPRMQMKAVVESMKLPELREKTAEVTLSDTESQVYEVLMEEDEITASEKIQILRQFLLNPDLLDSVPGITSSKIKALQEILDDTFKEKNKVIMFVNDYVEEVIRGNKTIFDSLNLPKGVELRTIMGGVSQEERLSIQRDLNKSDKKMFVVVNGQTADVGVDFSGAQKVIFYNEPWSAYNKRQQLARTYRAGLGHDLDSITLITKDTIEEGIRRYIEVKQKAIEKLLKGVPISELEKELLRISEEQPDTALEVNPELAEYYFSAWDRMMKIFTYVKEIGEKDFVKFLGQYGREYADCYTDLGSRSYQANASRVSGTLIDTFVKERGQDPAKIKILDIASGPEMLKHHIPDSYKERVFSIDLNKHHFEGIKGSNRVVGSFLKLPFQDETFDYANLSLAWHYTGFAPSRNNFERLEVLVQANRVLKEGGRLLITNIYTRNLQDEEKFRKIVQALGFRIVEHYTGEIAVGTAYCSHQYTLQKERNIDPEIMTDKSRLEDVIGKENYNGVKFHNSKSRLKDSRKIISSFSINGSSLPVHFNHNDYEIFQEESVIINMAELLKRQYDSISKIPRQEVLDNNFVRIKIGNRYVLFKKLEKGPGVVIVK